MKSLHFNKMALALLTLIIFCGISRAGFSICSQSEKPIAKINLPESAIAGSPVKISAADSYNPEGKSIRTFFRLGDGSRIQRALEVEHVYENPGSYAIDLWLMDSCYRLSRAQAELTVVAAAVENNSVPRFRADLVFPQRYCSFRNYNSAKDFNDDGLVVGVSKNCDTEKFEAYLFDSNTNETRILEAFGTGLNTVSAINNNGLIVGSNPYERPARAIAYDSQNQFAFPLSCGGILKTINDNNLAAGISTPGTTPGCSSSYEAMLWQGSLDASPGEFMFLGAMNPGDFMTHILSINNRGIFVGLSDPRMDGELLPFIGDKNSGLFPLGYNNDTRSIPAAINDLGNTVGSQTSRTCTPMGNGTSHCAQDAILWDKGGINILWSNGGAGDINNDNWIVGNQWVEEVDPRTGKLIRKSYPVLYSPDGQLYKIADLIEGGLPSYSEPNSDNRMDPNYLTGGASINNRNQILVGHSDSTETIKFSYILTPITTY